MGHYRSEMGGGRTTLGELTAWRYKAKKKIEKELDNTSLKITDFRKGGRVMLRKEFDLNLNPGFAYDWPDLFCTELGIGFLKVRHIICTFRISSVNRKEGKLILKSNCDPFGHNPYFEMDYRFMEVVKKRRSYRKKAA